MLIQPDSFKIPRSVLVVIYVPPVATALQGDNAMSWADAPVLLLERSGHVGFWQSVTGSLDALDEPFEQAAVREVLEETGIDAAAHGAELRDWGLENVYEIYPQWRWRYAPQVSHNTERVFGLRLTCRLPVCISSEHTAYEWLPMSQAIERCFSPSNAEAISWLPRLG